MRRAFSLALRGTRPAAKKSVDPVEVVLLTLPNVQRMLDPAVLHPVSRGFTKVEEKKKIRPPGEKELAVRGGTWQSYQSLNRVMRCRGSCSDR